MVQGVTEHMFQHINYSDLFSPTEVICYLRKSRADDALLTVEEVLQKHETMLDDWAERNIGAKVPPENKFFEVVSGETIADRPELQKVLRLIESPKVKAILCYDVSRLSRGDLEDAGRLIKLLRYTNTYVITLQKVYDVRDEYDRDIFERELKRGNEYLEYFKKISNNGRLLSVQQGNFIGNIPPYGYDKAIVMDGKKKCHTLTPNKEQADVVRMIFDMYVNQNIGVVNISNYLNSLNIPSPSGRLWEQQAIKNVLSNDHYVGNVRWQRTKTVTVVEDGEIKKTRPRAAFGDYLIFKGKHPAIIDEDVFNAARDKQGRNHRAKATTKVRNPLAGLLKCQCGRAMSLKFYSKFPPRLFCDGQTHCHTRSCEFSEMMAIVTKILKDSIADFEVRLNNDDNVERDFRETQIERLKAKLESIGARELGQWEKYSSGEMPKEIFDALNDKVKTEKLETQQALEKALAENPAPIDYGEKIRRFSDALDALDDDDVSAEKKNALLKACIDKIIYSRGEVDPNSVGRWKSASIEVDVHLKV